MRSAPRHVGLSNAGMAALIAITAGVVAGCFGATHLYAGAVESERHATLAEAMARRPEDAYAQARQKLESIRQRSNAALDAKIAETQRLLDLANVAAR